MIALVLDTHATVWLMLGSTRLSSAARDAIEAAAQSGAEIAIPGVSFVEIAHLEEKGSLSPGALATLFQLLDDGRNGLVETPLTRRTAAALLRVPRTEVPDMPDRIIAATALDLNVPLVTADSRIRSCLADTIW